MSICDPDVSKERGRINFLKQAHRFKSDLFDLPDKKLGTKVEGIASYFKIFVPVFYQGDRTKAA